VTAFVWRVFGRKHKGERRLFGVIIELLKMWALNDRKLRVDSRTYSLASELADVICFFCNSAVLDAQGELFTLPSMKVFI